AIAALAYGTETIPAVDKIVGPGNIYVATAKAMVFGRVGIDMIAGPSEIVIVCDGQTDPDWIAMDLFSQAEHDEQARAIMLSPEAAFLDAVEASIARQLPQMERAPIIRTSLSSPLGVYDFQKRSSLIQCSERAAQRLGQTASVLARAEGLTAHARSAEYRF